MAGSGDSALAGNFDGAFPFEARWLDAPGGRLHYVDEGPRDAKPVLMLHGNPTWSYMWRIPIARLADAGHRCIALDHMGFGRSQKPADPSAYTLDVHVQNTAALLEELDLKDLTLVLHDWGGPIGLGAALRFPDRLRALVAMNTWAWELPSFLPPFLREFRAEGLGEILALGANLVVEAIPGGMAERDLDPRMMDAYRAPFPDYWSRLGTLAFIRDIPLSEHDPSAGTMAGIQQGLEQLDLPMLLIWGIRDRVFRDVFLDQWCELFPDADVRRLEAAHYLVEDRPEEVAEEIGAFLARLA